MNPNSIIFASLAFAISLAHYDNAFSESRDLTNLLNAAESEGYGIVKRLDYSNGSILLKLRSRDSIISFILEEDNDLMLRSFYHLPTGFDELRANEWNKKFRWVKTYIDDDRDLVIEQDVDFPADHLPISQTMKVIGRFFSIGDIFSAWLALGANKINEDDRENSNVDRTETGV